MRRVSGFTLVELIVVISILSVLAALLVPSFSYVRKQAKLAACAGNMREIGIGLASYSAAHNRSLPPFAFSDFSADLPGSGHWGGSLPGAPGSFGRAGINNVNLWALVSERMIAPDKLICPAATVDFDNGRASYFGNTRQFSTYCLRFPYSADIFPGRVPLGPSRGGLLDIYLQSAGGRIIPSRLGSVGFDQTVPLIRYDRSYRTDPAVASSIGDGSYDVANDTMLADTFWWQDNYDVDLADGAPWTVQASWLHDDKFNALSGNGSVKTVTDDGTVAANSNSPGQALADDGCNFASYAENVWQFFDYQGRGNSGLVLTAAGR